MLFFAATFVFALAVVVCTRGSFERLGQLKLRVLWLLFTALAAQLALEFVEFPQARIEDLGFAILMGTYALILAFCWVNRRIQGMLLVAAGIALNILVISLNQGMPTMKVPEERNGRTVSVPIEQTVKHRPAGPGDHLGFLGDKIAVPTNEDQPISIGDIVLGLGLVDICFEGSRRPRRRGVYLRASAPKALVQAR